MGAGLNCWRLLLLVRGARICEIPDDAEMKGHHRICHLKDGTVSGMKLISTSGDVALEVPGATSQVAIRSHRCPANSLPRISHCGSPSTTTPQKADLDAAPASQRGQSSSKSGIKVSISPPDSGTVPIGRYRRVRSSGRYGDGDHQYRCEVERYWDGLLGLRLRHSEWGHVSGSEGFARSTFGRVDGYLGSRPQPLPLRLSFNL
jgi:hypothetical protein